MEEDKPLGECKVMKAANRPPKWKHTITFVLYLYLNSYDIKIFLSTKQQIEEIE